MDFGLAGLSEQLQSDVRSGTPAYMSPEQLAGTEVTARSDIYALGLVLYELFTGKRAFEAASLMELMQMQERAEPASISTVVRDLEPGVERIIMRCLDPSPSGRPASARAVAAGLGGDALAAALAAGETPSPELVAAAGESEGLRPKIAVAWLASALAMIAIAGYLEAVWSLTAKLPLEASPDALARDARTMLKSFGYAAKPVDTAYGLLYADRYLEYLKSHPAAAAARWRNPAVGMPPLIHFWYRESPDYMTPQRSFNTVDSENDPPFEISGMTWLRTDPDGKLLLFESVTPQREAPAPPRRLSTGACSSARPASTSRASSPPIPSGRRTAVGTRAPRGPVPITQPAPSSAWKRRRGAAFRCSSAFSVRGLRRSAWRWAAAIRSFWGS